MEKKGVWESIHNYMVTQVPKEMLHEILKSPKHGQKIVRTIQNEYGDQFHRRNWKRLAREQRLKNIGLDSSIPLSELAREDLEDERDD